MNEDGLPDLLLTTQTGIEIYSRIGSKLVDNFQFHGHVPWPSEISEDGCTVDQCVGQIVFADFDLSGTMDLAVPMCFDTLCKSSNMFLIQMSDLWAATAWNWVPMSLDLGSRHFFPPSAQSNPLQLLAPRVGDVDLDGYPDVLVPLQSSADKPETHLLLNVHCDDCHPFGREFQIRPAFMEGTGNAILGTFFDLSEDGRTDVLTVSGDQGSGFKTSAFTSDDDNDAYFAKVVVLSGACYHNCKDKSSSFVPYGTNSGGQMIYYKSQRTGPESFHTYRSCAAQLPQSAYFSLQTPYTIFGLGNSPNFLDNLWVTVSAQSHSWPQIIPNSQMYVIPYPPGDPKHWKIKISLFPSKNILMVGLALVGVCGVLVLLILLLHVRERRQDLQAKLQESNRFHFDAM